MKATGIVAEFNPLHNGHVYIMEEARRLTGCDALVVAMSGNFVQRGEPAVINKWKRAEAALRCGADLVFEIPTLFSLGDAGSFANAGVRILEDAGCDIICCGSESGNENALYEIANLIRENKMKISEEISESCKEGHPYPVAREKAVLSLINDEKQREIASDILSNPNDILTLEYMMAASSAKIMPVKRKGAAYSASFDDSLSYQSASGIRELARGGIEEAREKLSAYMPKESLSALTEEDIVISEDCVDLIRYAVMRTDAGDIDECPSGGEGLGNLIKTAALSCDSVSDIIMTCKSKRYTYTRIARLCMQVLLGIDRRIYTDSNPLYLRVLGFNEKGRQLLSGLKKSDNTILPTLTNINKETESLDESAVKMLSLDLRASEIYNLIAGRKIDEYSDHRIKPVIIE